MTEAGLKDIKQIAGLWPAGLQWESKHAFKREWHGAASGQYFMVGE
jgi:hypothetical protein